METSKEYSSLRFLDTAGVEVEREIVQEEIVEARQETIEQRLRKNKVLLNNLRQNDDAHNRTCALCLKRKPIDDFLRLKTSQLCKDCE